MALDTETEERDIRQISDRVKAEFISCLGEITRADYFTVRPWI